MKVYLVILEDENFEDMQKYFEIKGVFDSFEKAKKELEKIKEEEISDNGIDTENLYINDNSFEINLGYASLSVYIRESEVK